MDKKELKDLFNNFCKGKEFKLNTDKKMVDRLLDGLLENEKNLGLKYCPCRLTEDEFEKNLELICPCNFFSHDTWSSKGECWCGLFKKTK